MSKNQKYKSSLSSKHLKTTAIYILVNTLLASFSMHTYADCGIFMHIFVHTHTKCNYIYSHDCPFSNLQSVNVFKIFKICIYSSILLFVISSQYPVLDETLFQVLWLYNKLLQNILT